MTEYTEKQPIEKEYRRTTALTGKKHYACSLCHEKYDVTDEEGVRLTCCGLPVNKREEIIMSSPEPFGP